MNQPFRIQPLGPVSAYVTYAISASRDVGVVAACKDVGCLAWAHGWQTLADESDLSPLGGKARADYIRQKSGRTFREQRTTAGITVFMFEAFQRCFEEHRTRPDVLLKSYGDWRANRVDKHGVYQMGLGGIRRHQRPQDWIEDLMEHEGSLADQRQKG